MFRKYTLKQPAQRHARIGAFYAALPPVIIGMICFINLFGRGVENSHPALLPTAIALVVGAPLVTIITQILITKRDKLDYWGIVEVALICATLVQIGFSGMYLVYYALTANTLGIFSNVFSAYLTMNAVLWVVSTLPLTLICAAVFRSSAMRPVYG